MVPWSDRHDFPTLGLPITINLKVKSDLMLSILGVGITSIFNLFISSSRVSLLITSVVLGLLSAINKNYLK